MRDDPAYIEATYSAAASDDLLGRHPRRAVAVIVAFAITCADTLRQKALVGGEATTVTAILPIFAQIAYRARRLGVARIRVTGSLIRISAGFVTSVSLIRRRSVLLAILLQRAVLLVRRPGLRFVEPCSAFVAPRIDRFIEQPSGVGGAGADDERPLSPKRAPHS